MADDDEIDILGDFSFNSCLAQNNQGIPSCSSREDTVHPQWLMDSTATNWYDNDREKRAKLGPARKLSGNSSMNRQYRVRHSSWNQAERDLLVKEMAKYGRNVHKIAQTLKSKSAAEIQALIEAEYGVNLETRSFGLVKNEEQDDIPNVVQEEIVTDESSISNVLSLVTTASPTITVPNKHPFRKKSNNVKSKSLLRASAIQKPDVLNSAEIFYDDELVIGSTESVGSVMDSMDVLAKSMATQQKERMKAVKKIGNHRRKVSQNSEKGRIRTSSKELLKSPQERKRKDSSVSEDSTKSPKLQIVLGSGQALSLSEGEQVIKIEKKKESESDSDIEIDVDSDNEGSNKNTRVKLNSTSEVPEAPIAVPLTQFEPMPKRQKKINLPQDGGGGYTIAHTAAGDLVRVGAEPRRERAPRRVPVALIPCRFYDSDHPAPYSVRLHVSVLILSDAHAHSSHCEVMGLLGGWLAPGELEVSAYRAVKAAAGTTDCDMDPVSQAEAGSWVREQGLRVVGWHHSHPRFAAQPSATDLRTQRALQAALQPALALLTSQRASPARPVSHYRCFRVEDEEGNPEPVGYQLRVRLIPDATPALVADLRELLLGDAAGGHPPLKMDADVCPMAKVTYLEKCVASMCHYLRAAGYEDDDPLVAQLAQGLRDIFR